MAILHVSASGSSTSPYETWAKAASSLDIVDSLAGAGDTIYISHVFVSGYSATATLSFVNGTQANPVVILSSDETTGSPVDGDAGNYAKGALLSISSGIIFFLGDVQVWGVNLTGSGSSADFILVDGSSDVEMWHECAFTNVDRFEIGGGTRSFSTFYLCTFTKSGSSGEGLITSGNHAVAEFHGCTFTKGTGTDNLYSEITNGGRVLFEGCDVSDFGTILRAGTAACHLHLRGCEVSSSLTLSGGALTIEASIFVEACNNGTITVPALGLTEYEDFYGTIKSSLARHRTGGADDGEQANAHSWEMVSSANALELINPLVSPPIVVWDDGGAEKTFTVFVASGVTYQNDELWVQLIGPAIATSTATRQVERSNDTTAGSVPMNPRDTPANLTTDSVSTWNGTGVGTKQEISITYTPGIAGPVTIRVFLAKASSTVYIDPKIDVS